MIVQVCVYTLVGAGSPETSPADSVQTAVESTDSTSDHSPVSGKVSYKNSGTRILLLPQYTQTIVNVDILILPRGAGTGHSCRASSGCGEESESGRRGSDREGKQGYEGRHSQTH